MSSYDPKDLKVIAPWLKFMGYDTMRRSQSEQISVNVIEHSQRVIIGTSEGVARMAREWMHAQAWISADAAEAFRAARSASTR